MNEYGISFCPRCGEELRDESRYCARCGYRVAPVNACEGYSDGVEFCEECNTMLDENDEGHCPCCGATAPSSSFQDVLPIGQDERIAMMETYLSNRGIRLE